MCDAYELCCAAMCAFGGTMNVVEPEGAFRLARFFPDVQQLISESYLFKCKLEEAIAHLNEVKITSSFICSNLMFSFGGGGLYCRRDYGLVTVLDSWN